MDLPGASQQTQGGMVATQEILDPLLDLSLAQSADLDRPGSDYSPASRPLQKDRQDLLGEEGNEEGSGSWE